MTGSAMDGASRPATRSGLSAMSLAALGVVFGDIGTSPLYTLKTGTRHDRRPSATSGHARVAVADCLDMLIPSEKSRWRCG